MSLFTDQLDSILIGNNVTKQHFLGTYPACEVPCTKNQVYSFITNTQRCDDFGQHWCGWFVRNNKLTFFDSFGRSPYDASFPHYYTDIARRFDVVVYSIVPIQAVKSKTCGLFCIHFIYVLSLGLTLNDFISDYYYDLLVNDEVVYDFVRSIL